MRVCIVRGHLFEGKGSRCPFHQLHYRGWDQTNARRQVLSEEGTCWLCGEGPRPNDPLTLDHVLPRAEGGTLTRSNLRAAHATCNRQRQNV